MGLVGLGLTEDIQNKNKIFEQHNFSYGGVPQHYHFGERITKTITNIKINKNANVPSPQME